MKLTLERVSGMRLDSPDLKYNEKMTYADRYNKEKRVIEVTLVSELQEMLTQYNTDRLIFDKIPEWYGVNEYTTEYRLIIYDDYAE